MKVVSVAGSGVATIRVRVTHAHATANGGRLHLPAKALNQRIQLAPDGRVVSGMLPGFSSQGGPGLAPGMDQFAPLLPDHPVEPGDTWTREADVPLPAGVDGSMHLTDRVTLVGYQHIKGVRVAVIQEDGTIPLDLTLDLAKFMEDLGRSLPGLPNGVHPTVAYDGTIVVGGTSWLDPAAGRLVSTASHASLQAHLRFSGLPAGATAPDVSMSGTIQLSLHDVQPRAKRST
jgi:hypothetical protein